MTKKIYLLALFLIISVCIQAYLTKQFYSVNYGAGLGESICNINELFNCDSVALSKYSKTLGIPNALLGVFLNLIMLIGLLGFSFNSSVEDIRKNRWYGFFFTSSILSLIASLSLAFVSFFIVKKICIFCSSLYILSLLIFGLTFIFYKTPLLSLKALALDKTFLGLLISIPLLSLFSHKLIKNEYSPKKLELTYENALNNWKVGEVLLNTEDYNKTKPLFTVNEGAKYKLVEFADFMCSHCAAAHKTLNSFFSYFKDVEFAFYVYPLDASCNASMDKKYSGPGFTCTLAKGVYCAGKLKDSAAQMHDEIFENQGSYINTARSGNNSGLVSRMAKFLKIDSGELESCVSSDEAEKTLLDSSILAKKAKVQGTPSIYLNNKKLPAGANFMLLKRAVESL